MHWGDKRKPGNAQDLPHDVADDFARGDLDRLDARKLVCARRADVEEQDGLARLDGLLDESAEGVRGEGVVRRGMLC